MPSPITPSDIKAQLVTASGATCDKFLRGLFSLPTKLYTWFAYVYNEDGSFTDEFKADLCSIDCAAVGTGGGGSGILAPSLTWTPGTPPRLSWATVAGAAWYELARNTSNVLSESTLVATTTLNFIDDAGAASNTWYFYWVRGVSGSTVGAWSAAQLGARSAYAVTTVTGLATSGTPDYVELTWTADPEATSYQIVRNTSNTTAGATVLGSVNVPFYHDFTGILSTSYYYFLKASNPYNGGAFTTGVTGTRA